MLPQAKANSTQRFSRRLPMGAELVGNDEVHFRVWAPEARKVEVRLEGGGAVELHADAGGYFAGPAKARAGSLYRLAVDGEGPFPDPASRFQPDGPHGPSQVVDFKTFAWTDREWKGPDLRCPVLYEMHVGTFTRGGTWRAAAERLVDLVELGVTILEVMPVSEFPGKFGWGYDGVNWFAPTRLYGQPEDFRAFVDRAHALGLAVILDVVYNHLGPDGNYLKAFSPQYFTDKYKNEWGEALNFDGPGCQGMRELVLANAAYWIDEYHLDGLRLDATQQIFDASEESILTALGRRVREAARGRATYVVAENEPQHSQLVVPADQGGMGLDALWNDDFHHSARVALTGKSAAYFTDYRGAPQEFISATKWGYLFQGQRYAWQKNPRGVLNLGLDPRRFVTFLQNHDQAANSGKGLPLVQLTSPGRLRALTTLLLLGPNTPMLFQGQEFASSHPFFYFADHNPELARLVAKGRREFLAQFPCLALPDTQAMLVDPHDPQTFARCQLDWGEKTSHAEWFALHRDLIALRRGDPTFGNPQPRGVDGAVLGEQAFALRYFAPEGHERLLLVNLGRDLNLGSIADPLVAPPPGKRWSILWTSDDVRYGGLGTLEPDHDAGWFVPGEAAVALQLADRPTKPADAKRD